MSDINEHQKDLCIAIVYSGDVLLPREWAKRFGIKPAIVCRWLNLRSMKLYIDKLRKEKRKHIEGVGKPGKLILFAQKLERAIKNKGKGRADEFIRYMDMYRVVQDNNQNNPIQTNDIEKIETELRELKVLASDEKLN